MTARRIKIYADVDGTLNVYQYQRHLTADVEARGYTIPVRWNEEVIERLAKISQLDSVEWWWLTAWGQDARDVLDPLWGIESTGVMDWGEEPGDALHRSKWLPVRADQDAHRTPFVWMDDMALRDLTPDEFVTREDALFLSCNELIGIQPEDVDRIDAFIERWA